MAVTNIIIVGVGGQGTLLTSRILGGLAETAGYDVKLSEVHGMAQRGGSVVTYVRYATAGENVAEPIVEEGQADVIIAFERLEALRYAHFLKKDGVLIVNDQRIDPMPVITGAAKYPDAILDTLEKKYKIEYVFLNQKKYKIYSIDAMKKAEELGNTRVFNTIVLGMAAKHMNYSLEMWESVIKSKVPSKTVDINLKGFHVGYDE